MKSFLHRSTSIERFGVEKLWDLLIIGGGAAGLGCALDAARRGYKVLLVEKRDFASGTSSRSSKMIHGGVRYLKQGNLSLVRSALRERNLLVRNAPSLVKEQRFVIPLYSSMQLAIYAMGMRFYDTLARGQQMEPSKLLSVNQVCTQLTGVRSQGLKGGVTYSDGLFDDARLALAIAQAATKQGACLLNYMEAVSLVETRNGRIAGALIKDTLSGKEYEVKSRGVINASGIFVDELLAKTAKASRRQRISQGSHILLASEFLPGKTAMLIPRTSDGRVLFCIPWHNRLLVGTTDIEVDKPEEEPRPQPQELEFLLNTCGHYLDRKPSSADVLSTFAGQRPLPARLGIVATKDISREHQLETSPAGIISIIGGKWTTYRAIAEDAVLAAAAQLGDQPSNQNEEFSLRVDLPLKEEELDDELIHPKFSYTKGDIVVAVRYEMAYRLADVMARRTRMLMLDVRAAREASSSVAKLMAQELNKDNAWVQQQQEEFYRLSAGYLP